MSMITAETSARMQQVMLEAATSSAPASASGEPRPERTTTFASAIEQSMRGGAGWDPQEVWLTRVHRPRAGRRTW